MQAHTKKVHEIVYCPGCLDSYCEIHKHNQVTSKARIKVLQDLLQGMQKQFLVSGLQHVGAACSTRLFQQLLLGDP